MYEYRAKVLSVYDGDTITVLVDLGFNTFRKIKIRLYGINTPELKSKDENERKLAKKAKLVLQNKVLNKDIIIKTFKDKKGKYGRYLAEIYVNNININELMVKQGFAKPYFGGKRA